MVEELYEYHIDQVTDHLWIIYKVDHHVKEPIAKYKVTLSHGHYSCDCPASKYCKHIDQIKEMLNPKKSLF
jgi:hypothetical protein